MPSSAETSEQSRWFTEEVHPHGPQLKAYLRGSFPAVRDVEDVVQESYLRVWKARAVQPILSAKAFLFRVARNIAVDIVRHDRVSPISPVGDLGELDVIDDRPTAAEQLSLAEKIDILSDAISRLPPRCREIIIMCKLQGRSYRDVAEMLGVSEKTVAEHLYRGAKRLGEELQKRGLRHFGS